ncbi:MAG: DUF2935 domain-containing protein [Thermoflexaceae bacterium]|nr:DUF2935 domain-containing protein [Thermoflexaceae bacterium]
MKSNYVSLSLETHLFFGRIMKEHSLFLMAGFPSKNSDYIQKADWFFKQFEEFLTDVIEFSNHRVGRNVLESGEIFTEFTREAECKTEFLTGIDINTKLTDKERSLCPKENCMESRENMQRVHQLNQRALRLTGGLIEFKEQILKDMADCQLFTFNYPLLVEHIQREAKLYHATIQELERRGMITGQSLMELTNFWNRIMMEHAMFIRGLLDPCEDELIDAADGFAKDYCRLLEEARNKDCMANDGMLSRTIEETEKYRDFKAAGTKGIVGCEIAGLILPLLADHVLREANHYLRLLEEKE